MKKPASALSFLSIYIIVLCGCLVAALLGNHAVTVLSEHAPVSLRHCVIIDAGHGGVDGGATSCTGVLESEINLQIAKKLNDLMHLLGIETYMIRQTDISVYTEGHTIAAKKISDLKERTRIVNSTPQAVLLSIHQNNFTDHRYDGPQVFYAPSGDSKSLAAKLQEDLNMALHSNTNRTIKKANGIYLMQHINCTGVLVECGFLSNPEEEVKLRNDTYQKNICCVLACTFSRYINSTLVGA